MRKSDRGARRSDKPGAPAKRKRRYVPLGILLITVGVIAVTTFFLLQGGRPGAQSPGSPAVKGSGASTEGKAVFEILKGRWQRPDGGYVIEIRGIDPAGKMDARYFNPRPINVSQAEVARDGTTVKVFIELRDMNYPGATYHLTYDPGSDQLRGVYFQPALQQSFDVVFVRMK